VPNYHGQCCHQYDGLKEGRKKKSSKTEHGYGVLQSSEHKRGFDWSTELVLIGYWVQGKPIQPAYLLGVLSKCKFL